MLCVICARAFAVERPSPPELRRQLEEILASGYQLEAPTMVELRQWLAQLPGLLSDLLVNVAPADPLAGWPEWTRWMILGVGLAAMALLFTHMLLTVASVLRGERKRPRAGGEKSAPLDPEAARRRAMQALESGRFDEAVRLLYRAALLRLNRLGALTLDPSRTNWENLQALRAPATVRATMAELTDLVDATVYAGEPATSASAQKAAAALDALWRAEVEC